MKIKNQLGCFIILISIFFAGCSRDSESDLEPTTEEELFTRQVILGYSNDYRLGEVSGIVTSKKNANHFWVHNDGGDKANIYLIDRKMRVVQTVNIKEALYYESINNGTQLISHIEPVSNIDWEDITMSKIGDKFYIVVGDIGDNRALRASVSLYKFEEPEFNGEPKLEITAEKMILQYEEGPRDVETLMTDPTNGNMIMLSKRDAKSKIYSFPFQPIQQKITSVGEIDLTRVVGGDINANGDVLIKNYGQVFLIKNTDNLSIVTNLLEGTFKEVIYIEEPQGEALCWSLNNNPSYYTTSERRNNGKPEPLYYYY